MEFLVGYPEVLKHDGLAGKEEEEQRGVVESEVQVERDPAQPVCNFLDHASLTIKRN